VSDGIATENCEGRMAFAGIDQSVGRVGTRLAVI
jgi:hypothetical protein